MLEMKKCCEKCGANTDVEQLAFICSYECTFCEACSSSMGHVCPNCGGNLVVRPTRKRPAGTEPNQPVDAR